MLRMIVLLVLVVVVLVTLWQLAAPRPRPVAPAAPVVRRVRELAWDHRDLEPTLATALIEHIAQVEARGALDSVTLDELLDLAWRHRETDPSLSVLVVDLIRSGRREIEGE